MPIWKHDTCPLSYRDVNPRSEVQLYAKKKKKMQLHFCELFSENIFVIFGVDKGYKELCGLEQ